MTPGAEVNENEALTAIAGVSNMTVHDSRRIDRMKLKGILITAIIAVFATAAMAQMEKDKLKNPAALNEKAPDVYKANFDTSAGTFVIEVHRDWDPSGADRFYNLVKNGFYDDCRFFRVVPNFMVQFGINGDPAVAGAWMKAPFKDEKVKQGNRRGYVSFAKPGMPNSRTTQVFINFKDNSDALDSQGFSAFGQVTTGMNVVDKIYSGYGQNANQQMIQTQGNEYLKKSFPKMDYIKKATIAQ
jgi:peptidyl-prolyl cis-trans isomerase A (cyclophilin A)